jgi:hypothetical protein
MNDDSEPIIITDHTADTEHTLTIIQDDVNGEHDSDNLGGQESLIYNGKVISLAPGEGHPPILVLLDTYAEVLSFPTVFCGQPQNSSLPLSYTEIANSEIRRHDHGAACV